ncbi:MAG: hypothetical protein ACUVQF_05430 [Fervidobacterium sp.]|uniref:hypothetical protein n=1 Tax=Fervidobacterium sp. TaxID=1871331 RepID=UPI0040494047
MALGLREIIALSLLGVFLLVIAVPQSGFVTNEYTESGSVERVEVLTPKVLISAATLKITLSPDDDKLVYSDSYSPTLSTSQDLTRISGITNSVILGTKNIEHLQISTAVVSVLGVMNLKSLDISSATCEIKKIIIENGCDITISAAVLNGEIYVDKLQQDESVSLEINSTTADITVYVKSGDEGKIKSNNSKVKIRNW